MFLAALLPVLFVLGSGGSFFVLHTRQAAVDLVALLSTQHASSVDQYMAGCLADLRLVGEGIAEETGSAGLRNVFEGLREKYPFLLNVCLVDPRGRVQSSAGSTTVGSPDVVAGSWLQDALDRGYGVDSGAAAGLGTPHYVLAVRLSGGAPPRIVCASFALEGLSRVLTDIRVSGMDIFLHDREGRALARSEGTNLASDREFGDSAASGSVENAFWEDSTASAFARRALRHAGWVITLRLPAAPFFGFGKNGLSFFAFSVVCGIGVTALVALSLAGYVEKTLRQREKERETLREQLYRAGRLAELGEMAAGFAHEINNPLQIMKSEQAYIAMLLDDLREQGDSRQGSSGLLDEVGKSVEQIRTQIDRCARITHSILRFGRAGNVEEHILDLAKFLPEVLTMVHRKMALNGVTVRQDIHPSRMIVFVDPGRLQQVLLNLLNNALYAVLDAGKGNAGGEIVLACRPEGEKKILISVSDNGRGILPEHRHLIFTPFFTTKPAGSGTGLGLSLCHGIVNEMKGVLDFKRDSAQGATFFLLLPKVSTTGAGLER